MKRNWFYQKLLNIQLIQPKDEIVIKDHEEKKGELISDSASIEKETLNEKDEHLEKIKHKSNYIIGNK